MIHGLHMHQVKFSGVPQLCPSQVESNSTAVNLRNLSVFFFSEKLFERSPRNREGILWIYGDSLALRFYDSIHYTPLCSEIFRACNLTYSWVYTMLEPVQVEKFKKNYRDFDPYRVLQEIRDVIHMPEMDEKSVIILNCGLHYVSALKFAVYRQLIDDIIATFKEKWKNEFGEEQLKFRGKLIWKTTTAIHRERFLYHDHPSPRFLTLQVKWYEVSYLAHDLSATFSFFILR